MAFFLPPSSCYTTCGDSTGSTGAISRKRFGQGSKCVVDEIERIRCVGCALRCSVDLVMPDVRFRIDLVRIGPKDIGVGSRLSRRTADYRMTST